MTAQPHVTVVGAGIVGIACALELRKQGHAVTVIDRVPPGEGCSFGNAGLLAASSISPLAGPGTLLKVPRWLMDPEGPLFIQWRYLPRLMPWLLRYARAGASGDRLAVARALKTLTAPTVELYEDLVAMVGAPDLVRRSSYLYAYADRRRFEADRSEFEFRRAEGFEIDVLEGDVAQQAEPALAPAYRYGYLARDHGFTVNPHRLVTTLADHFRAVGGAVEQADVRALEMRDGGVRRLVTDRGGLDVDRLVVCAGAYSAILAKMLGDRIPLDTERGYHVTLSEPGVMPRIPVMNGDLKALTTPMEMGLRCAGTVELASVDAPPNYARAAMLLRLVRRMYPGVGDGPYTQWMGCRPTVPDSLPVIGRARNASNAFYAFGHQHLGLTCAPATARIVAQIAAGRQPNVEVEAFSPRRF